MPWSRKKYPVAFVSPRSANGKSRLSQGQSRGCAGPPFAAHTMAAGLPAHNSDAESVPPLPHPSGSRSAGALLPGRVSSSLVAIICKIVPDGPVQDIHAGLCRVAGGAASFFGRMLRLATADAFWGFRWQRRSPMQRVTANKVFQRRSSFVRGFPLPLRSRRLPASVNDHAARGNLTCVMIENLVRFFMGPRK